MTDYTHRIVDAELDELLRELAAVAIEGPKAVGKTATAERRAATVHRLDIQAVRAIAAADPTVLLGDPPPVLLDEWQHVPAVWDAVRAAVDKDPAPGRFLLAGSATPVRPPHHSGAGRIVRVRMRPLSLAERGLGKPTVSLTALLGGVLGKPEGRTDLGLADYVHEIVASGFPGIRRLSGRALRAQLDGYIDRIVDRDFEEQGYPVRRPQTLRRWMAAFAAATSTTTSLEKIRNAASAGTEDVPAKTTVIAYRNVLEQLWILDQVPGWAPTKNRLTRLTQAPKHHLVEPALAARLLGVDAGALLSGIAAGAELVKIAPTDAQPRDGTLLGQMFEALVTQSVRVYAQAAEANLYHCRTYDGRHEIDLILETSDQRILALEVKASAEVTDADVRHLLWLHEQLGTTLKDMVVITTGKHAYRRQDGVAVVPAVLLGP
ncbi:MAG TPA: DUF4143 domain-containing protein [Steroidobacteraceae bacterium]|nr:DUF4143 domain-containing protein [Steroidobacteraceae bacterium]